MTWNFVAGAALTADDLNQHLPIFVDKTADETRTSTTVCTSDTELFVDLLAGRTYDIELKVSCFAASATPDIKIKWINTGTMTELVARGCLGPSINTTDVEAVATAATTVGVVRTSTATTLATEISYGCDGTTVRGLIVEKFTLAVVVAGRLTMQWAQRASSASATTITGSSRIIAVPVA